MANLSNLAIRMRRLKGDLPETAAVLKRNVALAILNFLLENTPVDTSVLVSNWRVDKRTRPPRGAFELGKDGSTREAGIAGARAAGEAAIAQSKPGELLVIYNTVPYARFVNDGNSVTPPLLFVERAQIVGRAMLGTLKGLIRERSN